MENFCCGTGRLNSDPDFFLSWIPDPTKKEEGKEEIFYFL
jgi:hypothetical protein